MIVAKFIRSIVAARNKNYKRKKKRNPTISTEL